jgi:NADH-quinone oxidoreductase subunit G
MIKQGGVWNTVDWQTALEYVATGLKSIISDNGARSVGALLSPHSTLEELHLATRLMRALGSDNMDHRLRHAEFMTAPGVRYLGMPIADLSRLDRALVVGSNLRKDHPLFAQRIRQSVRNGCQLNTIVDAPPQWAMPVAHAYVASPADWLAHLSNVAFALANELGVACPFGGAPDMQAKAIALSLRGGTCKAVLLGNAAAHHPRAAALLAVANWIAEQTGATVGYLGEAANTVGAQLVGAMPQTDGMDAAAMLAGGLKAVFLMQVEPGQDSAGGANAVAQIAKAQMVVSLSPFKANLDCADVLLPIAPFTETPGTFVNAEGRIQSFHAVVRPLGDARPAWKVWRVLGNMLGLAGFEFDSSQDVLKSIFSADGIPAMIDASRLNNAAPMHPDFSASAVTPCVAPIYGLDALVRRASSLQMTADAQGAGGARRG